MNERGKSDSPILPEERLDKGCGAPQPTEEVEGWDSESRFSDYSSNVGPPRATRSTAFFQAFFPLKSLSPNLEPLSLKYWATFCGLVGSTLLRASSREAALFAFDLPSATRETNLFKF